jgi:malic enzyme
MLGQIKKNYSPMTYTLYVAAFTVQALSDFPQRAGLINVLEAKLMTPSLTSKHRLLVVDVFLLIGDRFVQLVRKHYPHSLLHFEDFAVSNAQRLLTRYENTHAVFNDDMYAAVFSSTIFR